MKKFGAVVLAGGRGERFGGDKSRALLDGLPLWRYPVDRCMEIKDCREIIIVGVGADDPFALDAVFDDGVGLKRLVFVESTGFGVRCRDMEVGLKEVISSRVVILESARPLVTCEQISRVAHSGHTCASFGMVNVDTVMLDDGGIETWDPGELVLLQAPQAFNTRLLRGAVGKHDGLLWSCEVCLMEWVYGVKPFIFVGGVNLWKVTYPYDLRFLEVIKSRGD